MQEEVTRSLDEWKNELETTWREIPKAYRGDHSVRRTLQCRLYWQLREKGYRVVADYMPPRIQDRPIDLIALNEKQEIVYAFCLDSVITLAAVKSLSSFESVHKVIFTTGVMEKKVQESRFFLKPEILHVHLKPFENAF
jgi:hypothetical protein